jgi:hypothetical protein
MNDDGSVLYTLNDKNMREIVTHWMYINRNPGSFSDSHELTKYKQIDNGELCLASFMVFIATFNNISAILWRSVLLLEETGVHGENHRPVANHWQTLSHIVVSSTPRHERGSNSQI